MMLQTRMVGARRPLPTARSRSGMTLVEVMVAVVILSIALLGLAGMSGTVARQLAGGGRQTLAAVIVQSRLDSLATVVPCRNLVGVGGTVTRTATTRGIEERIVISDNHMNVITITDTVRFLGRTKPLVYQSMIPCRSY